MNEHIVIIGIDKDGKLYNARWANSEIVCGGKTPEEAITNLFAEQYPGIWELQDRDNSKMVRIVEPDGGLGMCKKWIHRGDDPNITGVM